MIPSFGCACLIIINTFGNISYIIIKYFIYSSFEYFLKALHSNNGCDFHYKQT